MTVIATTCDNDSLIIRLTMRSMVMSMMSMLSTRRRRGTRRRR